ncbi:MAG: RTX toxin [Phycisphaerales bacterium]|nr:RTX toxin [Phycisphaerales bacterium]
MIGCHWPPPPPRPCWAQAGPSPNTLGQVENIANREVVGGINAAAPHPTNPQIVFAGGVNGGIWRSDNATAANPNWIRQTDTAESLSIGALEFDPTDPSNQTLVAGIGRFSSFSRRGGALPGLLRTTNGGTVWAGIDGGGTLRGLNISGVAPRGGTIVISVNTATSAANAGVWRSTNTGAAWTRISGGAGTGLPAGAAFDLAGDPANPARLFTNAGGNGVFRSTDTGATWTSVGSAAMNGLLAAAGNVEFSIGSSNNVFVAIVGGGRLSGIFRSGDGGTTWTSMDLPAAANGGLHPGGQGGIHLSIAADRTNANIVYVGGDRQNNPFPNVFGARDFSGLLFRGNASLPAGSQFTPLTHVGTTSNSSPHADSRDMDVDANGVVIEGDDGGIYRRTSPLNAAGDWFSMNGNLQTTEFHAIAWDANANIIVGGAQDTGSPQQQATGNVTWQSISTADGGDVAVDDTSTPGRSTRYSSNQFLGSFRRRVFNASNVLQSQVFPARTVLSGGAALQAQFYTPIKLNNVDATRLIIGGANSVYESLDQGDTLTEIGPGIVVNGTGNDPIAYGATGNANMLYVGSASRVLVRTAAAPAALAPSTYAGGAVVDLAIDPGAPNTAFAADATRVYMTANAGATWTDVTGNLAALTPGTIRSLVFRSGLNRAVVIGTDTGVFIAPGAAFNSWSRLGDCLPRVPVYDLDYDPTDRKFVAGTLGRGAWLLENQ